MVTFLASEQSNGVTGSVIHTTVDQFLACRNPWSVMTLWATYRPSSFLFSRRSEAADEFKMRSAIRRKRAMSLTGGP